jgi:hypothetical protein
LTKVEPTVLWEFDKGRADGFVGIDKGRADGFVGIFTTVEPTVLWEFDKGRAEILEHVSVSRTTRE